MADNTLDTTPEMDVTEPEPTAQPAEMVDYKAELEKARKALAETNRENAKRRKQLEAYEQAEAQRKQESMSELEKAQAALAELEKRAADAERGRKQALLEKAVIAKAGALRFNNAEDAIRSLDPEKLEIGDDGQVIGLEDALKAIAKDRPYLLQQPGRWAPPIRGGASRGRNRRRRNARRCQGRRCIGPTPG